MRKIVIVSFCFTLLFWLFTFNESVKANQNDKVSVNIGFKSKIEKQIVESLGGKVKIQLDSLPIISGEIPRKALEKLRNNKSSYRQLK